VEGREGRRFGERWWLLLTWWVMSVLAGLWWWWCCYMYHEDQLHWSYSSSVLYIAISNTKNVGGGMYAKMYLKVTWFVVPPMYIKVITIQLCSWISTSQQQSRQGCLCLFFKFMSVESEKYFAESTSLLLWVFIFTCFRIRAFQPKASDAWGRAFPRFSALDVFWTSCADHPSRQTKPHIHSFSACEEEEFHVKDANVPLLHFPHAFNHSRTHQHENGVVERKSMTITTPCYQEDNEVSSCLGWVLPCAESQSQSQYPSSDVWDPKNQLRASLECLSSVTPALDNAAGRKGRGDDEPLDRWGWRGLASFTTEDVRNVWEALLLMYDCITFFFVS